MTELKEMRSCVHNTLSEVQNEIIAMVIHNPEWIRSGQFSRTFRPSVLGLVKRKIFIEIGQYPEPNRQNAMLPVYRLDVEALEKALDFISLRQTAKAVGVPGWNYGSREHLESKIAELTTKEN